LSAILQHLAADTKKREEGLAMNARVTLFPRSAYKVMPWKNGAGSTTELLIAPRDATVQTGFDFRISLAQVPSSGPFSSFPGYERTIMLLRGAPMRLVHEGHGEHTLTTFQPYAFRGSWSTEGILSEGPVEDFNVMLREGLGRVHVDVQQGQIPMQTRSASLQFIWCWSGAATVTVQGQRHSLKEQESILIEEGTSSLVHLESASSVLIIVSFNLHSS
jgi:environmental stress-induced protein Ves